MIVSLVEQRTSSQQRRVNMKAFSTIEPQAIFIESTQNGYRVRLRKNIEQYTEEFEGETQTMFKYDEVVLNLSHKENINEYVTDNFEYLFSVGENMNYQEKIDTIKEYLSKNFLNEQDIDYYIASGIIESESEVM
jgi:hypothetical protein